MQHQQESRDSRFSPLRAEYDAAFETWCRAKRELDQRTAGGDDEETIRCFVAIVASAERQYLRKRNLLAAMLVEARSPDDPPDENVESDCILVG